MEDKFFLYSVINNELDEHIVVDKKFRWDKVCKNLLYLEEKFMENASEKLLRIIGLSPDLVNLCNHYYEEIFHNMVNSR
ncbi:MAG: hypothetical protein WCF03_11035 [Nitrososphaeraceae archaeon]